MLETENFFHPGSTIYRFPHFRDASITFRRHANVTRNDVTRLEISAQCTIRKLKGKRKVIVNDGTVD